MKFDEIKRNLGDLIPNMEVVKAEDSFHDEDCRSIYLGSYLDLDPCGKYHHALSPNGLTRKCEEFWENLEAAAEELGGWIEAGEGDPLDTYFCMPSPEKEEEE
jgi:hypothetical protein